MRHQGATAAFVNDNAKQRKTAEGRDQSAPVYFGGADNEEAGPEDVVDPPPCAYELDAATADELTSTFDLHDIAIRASGEGDVALSMAQPAEPVISLPLDERGSRSVADATPRYESASGQ